MSAVPGRSPGADYSDKIVDSRKTLLTNIIDFKSQRIREYRIVKKWEWGLEMGGVHVGTRHINGGLLSRRLSLFLLRLSSFPFWIFLFRYLFNFGPHGDFELVRRGGAVRKWKWRAYNVRDILLRLLAVVLKSGRLHQE